MVLITHIGDGPLPDCSLQNLTKDRIAWSGGFDQAMSSRTNRVAFYDAERLMSSCFMPDPYGHDMGTIWARYGLDLLVLTPAIG